MFAEKGPEAVPTHHKPKEQRRRHAEKPSSKTVLLESPSCLRARLRGRNSGDRESRKRRSFSQKNRRFSQIHPFSWKFKHLEHAGFSQKTADFFADSPLSPRNSSIWRTQGCRRFFRSKPNWATRDLELPFFEGSLPSCSDTPVPLYTRTSPLPRPINYAFLRDQREPRQ